MSRAQNRGLLAIGDLSPGQISDRQLEAKNRGFGDKSPDLLTLLTLTQTASPEPKSPPDEPTGHIADQPAAAI